VAAPALMLRYEKRLLAKAELLPSDSPGLIPADNVARWSAPRPMPPMCQSTPPVPSR
jgi:hypothetical protein